MENKDKRFAVLIDADNVSPKYIQYILDEVSDMGIATYKRIYGDWTDYSKRGWKETILEWSVNPIQQYSYTTGKNATDSAMIIDAMDILYSRSVDGFCLVSSDSDFTKLAQRLREAGMFVLGMGESKTPKPFRTACDAFKILDVISQAEDGNHGSSSNENEEIVSPADITSIHDIKKAIFKILEENNVQGRHTGMADLGNMLAKKFTEFDVRNYGYSKLSTFLESFDDFEVVKEGTTYYIVDRRAEIPKQEIRRAIRKILEQNNGRVENLSIVKDEVKREFPGFHVKQYGFSRFSSFVRSMEEFELEENRLTLVAEEEEELEYEHPDIAAEYGAYELEEEEDEEENPMDESDESSEEGSDQPKKRRHRYVRRKRRTSRKK